MNNNLNNIENQNTNYNNNKAIILVLILISLSLVCYIVYDKVITDKKEETVESKKDDKEPLELSIDSNLVNLLYEETKTECIDFRSYYYNDNVTLRSNIKDTDLNPNIDNGGCPVGAMYQTKLTSAKQYNDKIEIYEKHIYVGINNNVSGTTYVIYEEKPDFTDKNNELKVIDTISEDKYTNLLISNYLNEVSNYIFTFNKQNDNSYKLYSIKKES